MKTKQILLVVGIAMVAYGSYYWVVNRGNDKSLTDTNPPTNPKDTVPTGGSNVKTPIPNETSESTGQAAIGYTNSANDFYNN